MDKVAVLSAVRRLAAAMASHGIRADRMVLFGSWVAGTATRDSDIDLVVISSDFEGKSRWERIEALAAAHAEVFEPFDLVAMTPAEWTSRKSMIVDYAEKGEVLYG